MDKIIEKGRIAEWVLTCGCITLCLVGGIQGFLEATHIVEIILCNIAAVFGIENLNK